LLAGVNKRIENTIFEIKNAQAEKEKTKQARDKIGKLKQEVTKKLEEEDPQIARKIEKLHRREEKRNQHRPGEPKKAIPKIQPEKCVELKPGDTVRISGQNAAGELIELNDKNAVVAFGQLITTLPREQVERLSKSEAKKIEKAGKPYGSRLTENFFEKRLRFKPEIDIRGQRAEEAITKIQSFIDEAIMFEEGHLRILHGKGQGILKQSIRDYLRSEPMVRSFKDEHVDLGGAGITVVNLAL
jgi:DNA mismatch repair protein MutS2